MAEKARRLELNYAAIEDIDVAIASCEPSIKTYIAQFDDQQKTEVILGIGKALGLAVQEQLENYSSEGVQGALPIASPEKIDETAKAEVGLKWLAETARLAALSQRVSG